MYNNVQTSPNRIRNWLINGHNINHSYPQEQSPFDYRQSFDSYDANFNPFSIRQNNFFNFAPQMFHGAANNLDFHLGFNNSWGAQSYPLNPFQSPLINPMLSLASLWRNSFNPRGFFNHFNNLSSGRWMQVNPSNYQATNNLNYNNYFSNTNTSKYTPKTKSKSSKTYSSFSNKKSSGKPTKKTQSKGVVTKQQVKKKPQPNKQTNKQRSIIVHQNTTKTKTKPKKQIPVVGSNAQLIPATKKQPVKKQNPIKQTINQNQVKPKKIKQQPKLAYVLKAKQINKNISSPHAQKRMMASAYIAQSCIQVYDDFLAKNPDVSEKVKDIIKYKKSLISQQVERIVDSIKNEKVKLEQRIRLDEQNTDKGWADHYNSKKKKWARQRKILPLTISYIEKSLEENILHSLLKEVYGIEPSSLEVRRLVASFQKNPEKTYQDLSKKLNKAIDNNGIKRLAHSSARNWGDHRIKLNKHITSLDLSSGGSISKPKKYWDLREIAHLDLQELKLDNTPMSHSGIISKFHNLKRLSLAESDIASGAHPLPENLENLNKLEELNLNGRGIYSLREIGQLKKLKKLDISNNKFIEDYSPLENLDKLEVLKIGKIEKDQDKVIDIISKLKHLKELKIDVDSLSEENRKKLADKLGKQLERLRITSINEKDLNILNKFTNLQSLAISRFSNSMNENNSATENAALNVDNFKALKGMTKLKELILSQYDHIEVRSARFLPNYNELNQYLPKSLEYISLAYSSIDTKDLNEWKIPAQIKVLDLSETREFTANYEPGEHEPIFLREEKGYFKNLEKHNALVIFHQDQNEYHK